MSPTLRYLTRSRTHKFVYSGLFGSQNRSLRYSSFFLMSPTQPLSVAIVGVGLVGSELINQLLSLPSPSPFRLVSLSSSKRTVFSASGLQVNPSSWPSLLSSSSASPDLPALVHQLTQLKRAVLVDNTSSQDVADLYPEFLRQGVHIVTPNKKAFSGSQQLYDRIVRASSEGGGRWLNESTVGAGLPVVQTLKDMVASGDNVSFWSLESVQMLSL